MIVIVETWWFWWHLRPGVRFDETCILK